MLANVLISLSVLGEKKKQQLLLHIFPRDAASSHWILALTPARRFLLNWYLQTIQHHNKVPTDLRDIISTPCFSNEPSLLCLYARLSFFPPSASVSLQSDSGPAYAGIWLQTGALLSHQVPQPRHGGGVGQGW